MPAFLASDRPHRRQRHGEQHYEKPRGEHETVALAAHSLIAVLLYERKDGAEVYLALARVVESDVIQCEMYVAARAVVVVLIDETGELVERRYLTGARDVVADSRLREVHLCAVRLPCPAERPRHYGIGHSLTVDVRIAVFLEFAERIDASGKLSGAHTLRAEVHPVVGGVFRSEHHHRVDIRNALLPVLVAV